MNRNYLAIHFFIFFPTDMMDTTFLMHQIQLPVIIHLASRWFCIHMKLQVLNPFSKPIGLGWFNAS